MGGANAASVLQVVAIHSGGAAGAVHDLRDVVALKRNPRPDRDFHPAGVLTGRKQYAGAIGFVAEQAGVVHSKTPGQLRGHRGEHVRRGNATGNQCRHSPQRRLLVSEHAQFVLLAPALRDFAGGPVDHPMVRHHGPVQPNDCSVAAEASVLESHGSTAAKELVENVECRVFVPGIDDVAKPALE